MMNTVSLTALYATMPPMRAHELGAIAYWLALLRQPGSEARQSATARRLWAQAHASIMKEAEFIDA
jgi:hypothetical protein